VEALLTLPFRRSLCEPTQQTLVVIGFGVQAIAFDGLALCRMFNQPISGQDLPTRLSIDHDRLFQFHCWPADLRTLGVEAVPQVPRSHPFIERLTATIRREYLDHLFFWAARDLERKLELFKNYYNADRVHQGSSGDTPDEKSGHSRPDGATLDPYAWRSHCHGLFELPIAA
jgi:putative transposase